MNANEILPAIPRQKVIVTHKNGKKSKYDFIGFVGDGEKPHAVYIRNYGGFIHEHPIENCEFCEPVPEEPRAFRVGDKVVATDKNGNVAYTTIRTMFPNGTKILNGLERTIISTTGEIVFGEGVVSRHATPQECKDYFN